MSYCELTIRPGISKDSDRESVASVAYYIEGPTGPKQLNRLVYNKSLMDHLEEGTTAPDFQLPIPEGGSLKLTEAIRSGPIVLAFYKSSCSTSQFTLPFIQDIFKQLTQTREPRIWGISQDDAEETAKFVAEHGLRFPVAIDEHPYRVSSAYELRFVPTLFLIDQEQRIQMVDFGFSKPALNTIAKELAEWLGCAPPRVFSNGDGLPDRRPG